MWIKWSPQAIKMLHLVGPYKGALDLNQDHLKVTIAIKRSLFSVLKFW